MNPWWNFTNLWWIFAGILGLAASALFWLCRRLRGISDEDSYECLRRHD